MKAKRIVYMLMVIFMVVLLALSSGCSSSNNGTDTSGQNADTSGQDVETPEPSGPSPEEFFRGKDITFVVSTAPGGSYDLIGRLVSEYIAKYTGANVIVQNITGGGQIEGNNYIYKSAPDGLTIGLVGGGMIQAQYLGGVGVQFDLTQMTWLANTITPQNVAVTSGKSPYKSVEDLIAAGSFKNGNVGAGTVGYIKSVLENVAIGWNATQVSGYSNTNDMMMALMRGEIDIVESTLDVLDPYIETGDAIAMYIPALSTIPKYPEVRLLEEIPAVKERMTSQEAKDLIAISDSFSAWGRVIAGPPGIPQDRADYLSDIILEKVLKDPEFIATTENFEGMALTPMTGHELASKVNEIGALITENRQLIIDSLTASGAEGYK